MPTILGTGDTACSTKLSLKRPRSAASLARITLAIGELRTEESARSGFSIRARGRYHLQGLRWQSLLLRIVPPAHSMYFSLPLAWYEAVDVGAHSFYLAH